MIIKCCKDCDHRQVGCHGDCKEYIRAKKEHDKVKHDQRQDMDYLRYCSDLNDTIKKKAMRRKNYKLSKGPSNF